MTAPKYQEQECQHDTAASKEKEQLLPAPETLAAQDQKCGEADIDQQTDNQNPPLRGDTKYGERCQQIIAKLNPAALPSSSHHGSERNLYGKSHANPRVKADP